MSKKQYEFIFIDLDDTILDFSKAEEIAVSKTLEHFGIQPTKEITSRYSVLNLSQWKLLEKGELGREQVKTRRFRLLFDELKKDCDETAVARLYEKKLAIGHYFLPGAEELLERLHKKFRLYLASNGTFSVQRSRIQSAGIKSYFDGIFISEKIGADKPDKLFFEKAFALIDGFCADKALILGDSLTSDIQGGKNAGIDTVWLNRRGEQAKNITPDYEIHSLGEFLKIVE